MARTVAPFAPAAYYSVPRSDAYPYGYGQYNGHPAEQFGIPIPDASATYTKPRGDRTVNTVGGETVAVGQLTQMVQRQPVL